MNKEIIQVEEIETFLNKIISVLNSRVVLNSNNQIVELHILANNQRSAKQIIRDVQSALMTKFYIKIDHKVISIAQVYDDVDDENFAVPRLMIKSVEYISYNMTGKAKVTLEYDNNIYVGEIEGIHSTNQVYRLVGQAALNAVELFSDNSNKFILEEIKVVEISNRRVLISGVSLVSKDSEKLLIGKCIVENDMNNAIAKAVLDAVNRMLEINL